jgi:hypothetical protein
MKIGMVLVPRQDSWRKRLRGSGTTVGLKVLTDEVVMEVFERYVLHED